MSLWLISITPVNTFFFLGNQISPGWSPSSCFGTTGLPIAHPQKLSTLALFSLIFRLLDFAPAILKKPAFSNMFYKFHFSPLKSKSCLVISVWVSTSLPGPVQQPLALKAVSRVLNPLQIMETIIPFTKE